MNNKVKKGEESKQSMGVLYSNNENKRAALFCIRNLPSSQDFYQTNECQNPAPGQAMIMGQSISSYYSRYLGHLQLLEMHQGLLQNLKERLSIVARLKVPYTMFIQGMTKSRRPLTTISSRVY
ncbi:hypothetical protein I308_102593 [Cryptococcus tetragattii IND107]|uniref:Uncharacterized protein n=1 Tax=Cryptococcus tetragattii IND107 TaxID=1296105 RepID=A0ABR3BTZ0_9TREE